MSAWQKYQPLERKLEMKRRARVRRDNQRARRKKLLEDAQAAMAARPGAAFVRTSGAG